MINDIKKLQKVINVVKPPRNWRFQVFILIGVLLGLIFYIFHISNAVSYLSDNPEACINCHVMTPGYATWQRGSHGKVANCNDCHVPQDNFLRKYLFKASDGLRHATMFTLRMEPQVIRIKQAGKNAVQENCIRCHKNQIHPVSYRAISNRSVADQHEGNYCWNCHRETPHGKIKGLSSTPIARVPKLNPAVPDWIKN
jgi:cytochrome c nitrite reductase small subunit